MIDLFIDTNVYLTFFHFSKDDLEELKKLAVAIKHDKIRLYVTEQIKSEFYRNRELKINDAIRNLQPLPKSFPQIFKENEQQYKIIQHSISSYEVALKEILATVQTNVKNNSFNADEIISELFHSATCFEMTDEIYKKAKKRVTLGNPPGKDNSYGDAINWESLLALFPNGERLYFISADKDYTSPIDENALMQFLDNEWIKNKSSKIHFYSRLSLFFKDNFPNIKLALDLEKEIDIEDLTNCWTFYSTHQCLARLSKYNEFSKSQVNNIIQAAIKNDQIYSIRGDSDVNYFFKNLHAQYSDLISDEFIEEFQKYYIIEEAEPVLNF